MNADQAREAIAQALAQIAPEADLAEVDPEGDLREQLDLDSMDFLNLVVQLDQTTGVAVSEDDYPELETLTGAVRLLVSRAPTVTA